MCTPSCICRLLVFVCLTLRSRPAIPRRRLLQTDASSSSSSSAALSSAQVTAVQQAARQVFWVIVASFGLTAFHLGIFLAVGWDTPAHRFARAKGWLQQPIRRASSRRHTSMATHASSKEPTSQNTEPAQATLNPCCK